MELALRGKNFPLGQWRHGLEDISISVYQWPITTPRSCWAFLVLNSRLKWSGPSGDFAWWVESRFEVRLGAFSCEGISWGWLWCEIELSEKKRTSQSGGGPLGLNLLVQNYEKLPPEFRIQPSIPASGSVRNLEGEYHWPARLGILWAEVGRVQWNPLAFCRAAFSLSCCPPSGRAGLTGTPDAH